MKNIFKTLVFLTFSLIMFSSCEKETQIPEVPKEIEKTDPVIDDPSIDSPADNTVKDYFHAVSFLPISDFFRGGGAIDLATGNVYNQSNIVANLHNVDLVYLNFDNATGHNIALPTSKVLSVNEFGEDVQYGWRLKNKGLLYTKTNLQPQDIEWFNNLKSASQIRTAVDSVVNVLGIDKSEDRLRDVKKDQILIFKSLDRNVVSVIYVNNTLKQASLSQVKLTIKSDANTLTTVPPAINSLKNENNYYADTMVVNFETDANAELYLDFKRKKVYTEAELDEMNDYSGVTFLFAFNKSLGTHLLIGPRSQYIGNNTANPLPATPNTNFYYNQTLRDKLLARNDTHDIRLIRIDNLKDSEDKAYSLSPFEEARLNNKALYDYFNKWISSSYFSYSANPIVGRVIRVRSATDGGYGVFKVLELKKTVGEPGKFVIAVKYYNSID